MKQNGTIAMCLAGGLILSVSAQGVTPDGQGNPYQSVIERNVFALKPKPRPEDNPPPKPPTPPIELQGITSMFGRKQVMFSSTVPGSKPGEPPKKASLVLKVGERAEDFEVLEIDEKAGSVKFNNHGTEEIKYLEKDSSKIVATAPPPAVPAFPGVATPGAAQAGRPAPGMGSSTVTTFGGSTLKNIPSRTLRGPAAGGGAPVVAPATGQPHVDVPSPEAQAALMILQKAQNPEGPPIPPIPGLTE